MPPTDDPLHPFTEDEFDQMEQALASSKENEEAIKKAQRAGIELPGMLEQNREVADRLRRLLTAYRPGR
tara:strand:+ start:2478 stop:2684 length:207 start_codon:yes stop_codon:yes gene_type:complete